MICTIKPISKDRNGNQLHITMSANSKHLGFHQVDIDKLSLPHAGNHLRICRCKTKRDSKGKHFVNASHVGKKILDYKFRIMEINGPCLVMRE